MDKTSSGDGSEEKRADNPKTAEPHTQPPDSAETLILETELVRPGDEPTARVGTREAGTLSGARHPVAPKAGGEFGSYRLLRLLGQGGFGQVWEAESLETGRRLALKVLTEVRAVSPELAQRFEQEGRLAASLNHPHCVYIFGAEEIEGYPAITMELMPGGTLQDLLNQHQRLPVKPAVDYILDIIEGLEAAHEKGILHRDVKPSNCFLDEAGKARIGDFGLSKTLEADTKLTVSGTFLGTPSYASPEQVRGRDVDFRSDIYAVGATLYALLTGKPPFEGKQVGEVLARILSEEPTPFSEHEVDLPKGLRKVVLRMLAKDKERRYPSYAALRTALMPYSSEGLMVASPGKRFAALMIDGLALVPLGFLLDNVVKDPLEEAVISPALLFSYFFLSEKLKGCSLGKYLLGLRVTKVEGSAMTLGQALLRTFVFVFFLDSIEDVVNYILQMESFASWFLIVGWSVLILTMRRRNGYAGLHELVSRTRVRSVRQTKSIEIPELYLKGKSYDREPRQFGVYRVTETLWETDSEVFLMAYDDRLGRTVWIHQSREPSSARSLPAMAVSRPHRLHWLQGAREPGNHWDAYEAPSGTSFYDWVTTKGKLSWAEMRGILLGLATELKNRLEEEDRPKQISIYHIWIDSVGQTKLLEFPIARNAAGRSLSPLTPDQWRPFLHQVAVFGLEGRLIGPEDSKMETLRIPLPEYIRPLMDRLCERSQDEMSLGDVISELQTLATRPAQVTRTERMGPFMATAAFPLTMVVYALITYSPLILVLSSPQYVRDIAFTQTEAYVDIKAIWEENPDDESGKPERRAIRMLLASSYAQLKNSPHYAEFTANPYRRLFSLPEDELETALKEFPSPSDDEMREARQAFERAKRRQILLHASVPVGVLAILAGPIIILSFIVRGGVILSLFGIAVQTKEGQRASRLRCLARALVGWVPWVLVFLVSVIGAVIAAIPLGSGGALTLILVVAVIHSIVKKPERGLPDLIVGTHLVPR